MTTTRGERIKKLLKARNMTAKELANKINVTEAAMSRYIHENRTPKSSVLAKMAKVLGTTMDYLETGEEKKKKKTMTNDEALEYFEHDIENLKEQQFYDENDTAIAADLVAIQNTEFRIPKTPMYKMVYGKRLTSEAYCIECGNTVFRNDDYCSKCGQAIDWSEVDNVSRS